MLLRRRRRTKAAVNSGREREKRNAGGRAAKTESLREGDNKRNKGARVYSKPIYYYCYYLAHTFITKQYYFLKEK